MKLKRILLILQIIILCNVFAGCTYSTLEHSKNKEVFREENIKNNEISMFNEDLVDQDQEVVKINKAIIAFEKVHDLLFNINLKSKESVANTKKALKPLLHESIQEDIWNKIDKMTKTEYENLDYNGIVIHEMKDATGLKINGEEKKAFYITYSIKEPQVDYLSLDAIQTDGLVIVEGSSDFKVLSFLGL